MTLICLPRQISAPASVSPAPDMATNTKQITSADWERHREIIVGLRRSGIILEGDDGIIATMKRDHGFIAR